MDFTTKNVSDSTYSLAYYNGLWPQHNDNSLFDLAGIFENPT